MIHLEWACMILMVLLPRVAASCGAAAGLPIPQIAKSQKKVEKVVPQWA
jgi:hypothetical protein